MRRVATQDGIEGLSKALGDAQLKPWDYATAAIIFAASIVIGRAVRTVVKRTIDRSRVDSFLGDLIGRIANYLIVCFGIIYTLETLDIAIGPVLGALGIAGIALAFAFQNILENFVAGIILQLRQPFTSGDEIETAEHQGRIISVNARTITIHTPDGETVHIPSADVLKNPIINLTDRGKRRTTVDVGVAYDSDLEKVTQLALQTLRQIDAVLESPPPEVLVHTYSASSIDIAIRYWHRPSITEFWQTRDAVIKAVTKSFGENGVTIPFPQQVLTIKRPDTAPELS